MITVDADDGTTFWAVHMTGAVNFFGGWGDSITGGGSGALSQWINRSLGYGEFQYGGGFYTAGQTIGAIHAAALPIPKFGAIAKGGGVIMGGIRNARTLNNVARSAKAVMIAANFKRGMAFEAAVLKSLNLVKNTALVIGQTVTGAAVKVIPDAITRSAVWEIKSGAYISHTKQLQAMINFARSTGRQFNLVVRQGAKWSGELEKRINLTGGQIIVR